MVSAALLVLAFTIHVQASPSLLFPKTLPSTNPFAKLFQQNPMAAVGDHAQPVGSLKLLHRRERPRIVCGMTVIPTDPRIDPRILIAPPDTRTKFSLRTLTPPVCRP